MPSELLPAPFSLPDKVHGKQPFPRPKIISRGLGQGDAVNSTKLYAFGRAANLIEIILLGTPGVLFI
jgi:hypothetical protein